MIPVSSITETVLHIDRDGSRDVREPAAAGVGTGPGPLRHAAARPRGARPRHQLRRAL